MLEKSGSEAVIIFASSHYLLRAEQTLLNAGLEIAMVPAPKESGELCTRAICIAAELTEQVRSLLAERRVEVKSVMPYQRPKYTHRPPDLQEIKRMLEASGGERTAVLIAAGKLTDNTLGNRMSVMAMVGPDGAGIEEALALDIPMVLIHYSGERPDLALLRSRLEGERCIATVWMPTLSTSLVEELRTCGVQYFLSAGADPAELSPAELADELVFLRDNPPGLVGTGSLIPLVKDDDGEGLTRQRVVQLMAVARLVLPEAYVPAPAWLWPGGVPGSCNLVVVDARGGELESSVRKLQGILKGTGRRLIASVEERCL